MASELAETFERCRPRLAAARLIRPDLRRNLRLLLAKDVLDLITDIGLGGFILHQVRA
jgi:hypothetical protein